MSSIIAQNSPGPIRPCLARTQQVVDALRFGGQTVGQTEGVGEPPGGIDGDDHRLAPAAGRFEPEHGGGRRLADATRAAADDDGGRVEHRLHGWTDAPIVRCTSPGDRLGDRWRRSGRIADEMVGQLVDVVRPEAGDSRSGSSTIGSGRLSIRRWRSASCISCGPGESRRHRPAARAWSRSSDRTAAAVVVTIGERPDVDAVDDDRTRAGRRPGPRARTPSRSPR